MNELALFAGIGGGILGGHLLGWRTVCAVELDDYCRRVLMQRQDDGHLEAFPIFGDIREFDGRPWAGCVDIVTGGFPCQDISGANARGSGIDGARSGLWSEMARVVREIRPLFVFVENSPVLASRGLGRVLGDLAALGYDATWDVLGAKDISAPHNRDRMWILAYSDQARRDSRWCKGLEAQATGQGEENRDIPDRRTGWPVEPNVDRVAYGLSGRVDRIGALGNAQVPRVAAAAFALLAGRAALIKPPRSSGRDSITRKATQ